MSFVAHPRLRLSLLAALLVTAALLPRTAIGADVAPVFRAGARVVDITPPTLPVLVNGGMTTRSATKIVDRLHARALVLDDGTTRVAIVVVDSCMVPRDLLDRSKKRASAATGIPIERMLISSTHTHSAPAAIGCLGTEADPAYVEFLPSRIARAIELAAQALQPARAGWGVARSPENVFCRRWVMKPDTARSTDFSGREGDRVQMNPGYRNANALGQTGPVDDAVTVLSIRTADGKPLALLGNYSTHYAGAPAISADYFGEFCREVARRLGTRDASDDPAGSFVALMSNGTSGDANCIDFSRDRRQFDHLTVAADVARAAITACSKIEYRDRVPLAMAEKLLRLDVRMPSADEVERARQYLAEHVGDRPPKTVTQVYARETVLLSEMPPTRELRLQALRVGDLGVTAIPCEVYGVTGLRLKHRSPFTTTMNISLANGGEGYIPPPDQHLIGGYTTWRARSSCLETSAEPKIVTAVLELLRGVATGE